MACPQGSRGSFWRGQLGEELHFRNQMHPFSLFVGGFSLSSGGCYSLSFPKAASARCLLGALAWLGGRKVLKLSGKFRVVEDLAEGHCGDP